MRVAAIIPAAGCGRRMGGIKKPYLDLAGKPILAHTLMVFHRCPLVSKIVVIVAPGDEQKCIRDVIVPYGLNKADQVVSGGETRQESVFNGLRNLTSDIDMAIIHDCVRPFVTDTMVEDTLKAAMEWGAATVAIPVKDTIKEADDENFVIRTLNRQRMWSIQTPQAFKYDLLIQAHLYAKENNIQVTDDASLIEALGIHRVKLVIGTDENIKITTPGDLAVAEAILKLRAEEVEHGN